MLSPALKNMILLVGSVVFFYLWNEAVVLPYQTPPKIVTTAELQKMINRPPIINTILVGLSYLSWMLGSFALIRLWELAEPDASRAFETRMSKRLNAWIAYLLDLRNKVKNLG